MNEACSFLSSYFQSDHEYASAEDDDDNEADADEKKESKEESKQKEAVTKDKRDDGDFQPR